MIAVVPFALVSKVVKPRIVAARVPVPVVLIVKALSSPVTAPLTLIAPLPADKIVSAVKVILSPAALPIVKVPVFAKVVALVIVPPAFKAILYASAVSVSISAVVRAPLKVIVPVVACKSILVARVTASLIVNVAMLVTVPVTAIAAPALLPASNVKFSAAPPLTPVTAAKLISLSALVPASNVKEVPLSKVNVP